MQISGYKFHLFKSPTLCSSPGIFIYIHQTTGKCFVRAMRNIRMQRGKNNYPTPLKELLKTNASEVLVYLADLPKDTKEALNHASRIVRTHLTLKGVLYVEHKPKCDDTHQVPVAGSDRFTVWKLTHRLTGAVYYFEEVKDVGVLNKISQRMLTFNNYVLKDMANANRVMYHFAKKFFPLDIAHWIDEDLYLDLPTKQDAARYITALSKKHLENKEAVLNRINSTDALYYRNTMLKLAHIGIDEYLQ